MDNKEETFELIESYLSGEMDQGRKLAFERRLENEPDLKQQLTLHQEIEKAVMDEEEIRLEQTLHEIMRNEAEEAPEKKGLFIRFPVMRYLAAAGVALLVGLGIFWAIRTVLQPPTPEAVYAMYYEPYPAPTLVRDDLTTPLTQKEKGFEWFNAKEFDSAQVYLEPTLLADSADMEVKFFLALCKLEQGEPAAAIAGLEQVIEKQNNVYVIQARWYTALCWLKLEEPANARPILEQLEKEQGKYGKLAKEALGQLQAD